MGEPDDPTEREPGEGLFDLLSGTPDGVFAVDRGQRLVFWNDGARRILGFEPSTVLGRCCYEVLEGTDEDGCTVCRQACATYRASVLGELSPTRDVEIGTREGGRKWVSLTTFRLPSRWHALSLLAHVFHDAGPAKQLESRLRSTLQEPTVNSLYEAAPHPGERLTPREREVLNLLASGASTERICLLLRVQRTTVRSHVARILDKLGVHSRLEAVTSAAQNGWLGASIEQ